MIRKIYWGELSVPFVFACITLSAHFGQHWLILGFIMFLISVLFSAIRPFKKSDDKFYFFTPILHYIGAIGLTAFFNLFFNLTISSSLTFLIIGIIEYLQKEKYLLDSFLDILFGLFGIFTFNLFKM